MNPRRCQTKNDAIFKGFAETRPDNSLIRSYVWGTDLSGTSQGAGGVGGLLEISYYGSSTTNCFPAYDGNGNIMALVNAADGTVAANYDYAAFGEPIRITGVMARNNPFRFSTKYADDESDLLYYGYRYYKPSTGTWPNRDPLGEKTRNDLYGFVANNPLTKVDLFGLDLMDGQPIQIYPPEIPTPPPPPTPSPTQSPDDPIVPPNINGGPPTPPGDYERPCAKFQNKVSDLNWTYTGFDGRKIKKCIRTCYYKYDSASDTAMADKDGNFSQTIRCDQQCPKTINCPLKLCGKIPKSAPPKLGSPSPPPLPPDAGGPRG